MSVFDTDLRSIIQAEFAIGVHIVQGTQTCDTFGIFDNPTSDDDRIKGTYTINKRDARVVLFALDIEFEITDEAVLTIDGEEYRVRNVAPDNTGSIVISLK